MTVNGLHSSYSHFTEYQVHGAFPKANGVLATMLCYVSDENSPTSKGRITSRRNV